MPLTVPNPHLVPLRRRRVATTQPAAGEPRMDPLRQLDRAVERSLGADLRLIYGLASPVLLMIGALLALFIDPAYWVVGVVLVLELCCLGLVVSNLMAMLEEPAPDEPVSIRPRR